MAGIPSTIVLLLLFSYFLGSIPFGLLFARLFGGSDVRQSGSGNIGATNVARVAGPLPGILTLAFDAAKGALAVLLAVHLTANSAAAMMFAGLAALLGHCFPVWLRFKGGKGVATGLGVFAALCPLAAMAAMLLFVLVFLYWRFASLASISAAAATPLLVYFLWAPHHAPPLVVSIGTLFAAALIMYKHDANLQRLVEGTEPRFVLRKSKRDSA
jgi:acyl phosphate:glycerol-3-phosphate acyltransferase